MKFLRKGICLLLVAAITVSLAACENSPTNKEPSVSTGDNYPHRENYVSPEEQKWVDTDGNFEYTATNWDGPKDYVIVIPAGNSKAKASAQVLQAYYQQTAETTVQIVTDSTAEKEKEILIGKTKRDESAKDISESELEVSVKGKKLVFDGGHDVTIDSAVQKFCRLDYNAGKANTFKITTDFSNTCIIDGYDYVWGDEFEGTDIDPTKWYFIMKMIGSDRTMMSYDRDVINTEDGRLKLRAIRYFDPNREGTNFKMPYSTATIYNMSFVYGYCEIRARLPFFKGAWPSFWTQSNDELSSKFGVNRIKEYMVEVDIFEVFGSTQGKVVSNIHKWYDPDYYDYSAVSGTNSRHTQWSASKSVWFAPNLDTMNQEYHTYGWEWNPKEMNMYVDGEKIMTYDIVNSYDACENMAGFHDPQYVMFNNHVTSIDSVDTYGYIEDSFDMLPSEYFIDYIRLYQKGGEGKLYTSDAPNDFKNRK